LKNVHVVFGVILQLHFFSFAKGIYTQIFFLLIKTTT